MPHGASVMLLPQRPYIPIGTLRAAVSYPSPEGSHDDAAILRALEAVRLPALVSRLGDEANWSQILSGGEQAETGCARALLARPDWLLLDESTSALDEPLEDAIYAAIAQYCRKLGRVDWPSVQPDRQPRSPDRDADGPGFALFHRRRQSACVIIPIESAD